MNGAIDVMNQVAGRWWPVVVHGGWQSAAVAAVILTVVWRAKHWPAPLRCGLVAVALVKFLCPPLLSVPTGVFSHLQPAFAPHEPIDDQFQIETHALADGSRDEGRAMAGMNQAAAVSADPARLRTTRLRLD